MRRVAVAVARLTTEHDLDPVAAENVSALSGGSGAGYGGGSR